jgi:transposase
MSRALGITFPISTKKLDALARKETNARVRVRLLAIRLVKLGHPATAAALELGLGESQTCVWVRRFNRLGPAGLRDQKRKPRSSHLAPHLVEAFKARVRQGPREEDGVSVLRGKDIRRILQREFAAQVSLTGTYYILHRVGFSSLQPRPQHPQSDPAAQAAFKKKAALVA